MYAAIEIAKKIILSLVSTIDRWNASLEETNKELDQVEREIELEQFQKGPPEKTWMDDNPMFKKIDTTGGFWETIRRC